MYKHYIYIISLTAFLSGCVNIKGDLGTLSRNADLIPVGYSIKQIADILGRPQLYFVNPNDRNLAYAHYCYWGIFEDDANGFFLYKDRMYKRVQNHDEYTRSTGVYSNGDYSTNCYNDVRIDWSRTPLDPASQARAEESEKQALRARQKISKEYFIDGLIINHFQYTGVNCVSGGFYQIKLKGSIGPDSSFAIEKLLKRSPNCEDENNEIVSRTSVILNSGGGMLKDGYMMGEAFRSYNVETVIGSDTICASACAVAYLGGVQRVIRGQAMIMFHSPYLPGLNAQGERTADCKIGTNATQELLTYYQNMTSVEEGQRLMNRTMSYCSAEDGWVVKGYDAAELFGIATKFDGNF